MTELGAHAAGILGTDDERTVRGGYPMIGAKHDTARILVVDDEQSVLDSYRQILHLANSAPILDRDGPGPQAGGVGDWYPFDWAPTFDVTLCRQGDEAVETIRGANAEGRPFSVGFLDVRMPGHDGVWTAEHIRAIDSHVQIVMVTAYSDVAPEDIARRCPPPGRLLYIQKPFHAMEIQQFAWTLSAKWWAERMSQQSYAKLQQANELLRRDILARKRLEKQLRLRAELLDAATDSIFLHDFSGNLLYVNEAACRYLGYTKEELIGRGVGCLNAPEDAEDFGARMETLRARGQIVFGGAHRRKDGSVIPVEVHARTIESEGQELVLSVARDVTERKRAEEERDALEQQLFQAQKLEALATLAGGLAHDFNNLLTGIIGLTQLAQQQVSPDSKANEYLSKIPKHWRRAADLIASLLAFSRRSGSERRPLALVPLFKETLKIVRHALPEDINIQPTWSDDLAPVRADPTKTQQVIMNLVTNAQDAMPGGGDLFLELSHAYLDEEYCRHYADAEPGNYVCLCVRDTGIGMSLEVQQRVFEPFFTTKEEAEGTGLGLATVYGIVRNYGGHIHVYSEAGKGTELKVYLPAVEANPVRDDEFDPQSPPRGTERLLLVEDDLTVLSTGQGMLESLGYTVLTAVNGQEALNVYRTQGDQVSLVLSDMTMPKMGAEKLYDELVQIDPGLRMVAMSGYGSKEEFSMLQAPRIKGFVPKPFDLNTLAQAVREALDD